MKVLLRSDVRGIGRRGDIVEVRAGYARNFLLPTGAALEASDSMETQAASMRKSRDVRDVQSREAAEAQRAMIEQARITVAARAGANGRLFGSVSEVDLANAIHAATNVSLDRHAIHLAEHVKELGFVSVSATLFDDVVATFTVEVVAK